MLYFISAMNNSSTHKESQKASEGDTAKFFTIYMTLQPRVTDIVRDTETVNVQEFKPII
jgi:hypothetical protein